MLYILQSPTLVHHWFHSIYVTVILTTTKMVHPKEKEESCAFLYKVVMKYWQSNQRRWGLLLDTSWITWTLLRDCSLTWLILVYLIYLLTDQWRESLKLAVQGNVTWCSFQGMRKTGAQKNFQWFHQKLLIVNCLSIWFWDFSGSQLIYMHLT